MAWLLPSEVQPLETRSVGQSFSTAVNFLVSAMSHMEHAVKSRARHTRAGESFVHHTGS